MNYRKAILSILLLLTALVAACRAGTEDALSSRIETIVVTQVIKGEVVEVVVTSTPAPASPAPAHPRTLVICVGQDPGSLLFDESGGGLVHGGILEAVMDGPIDFRSFDYQAVILEKIPSLADGDAVIEQVEVRPGEVMQDGAGEVAMLAPGVVYAPSGCRDMDCMETFENGEDFALMDKMAVTFRLLPDLMWSDGAALTAADSVYAFLFDADPDSSEGASYQADRTESYEALDELTVQWKSIPGYIDSTYFLSFWSPMPEHAWGQYSAAELLNAGEVFLSLGDDDAAGTVLSHGAGVIKRYLDENTDTEAQTMYLAKPCRAAIWAAWQRL